SSQVTKGDHQIGFRFLSCTTALWANYEASKTFSITIINDAGIPQLAAVLLSLTSLTTESPDYSLNTSSFVERFLYPDPFSIPQEAHIPRYPPPCSQKSHRPSAIVSAGRKVNAYVIDLSPSLLEEDNHKEEIVSSVLRAMVRVWLWDGKSGAPARLLDGVVEYVADLAGFSGEEVAVAWEGSPECEGRRRPMVDG
ncbi:uncharacterized protein LOC129317040, partial [Prosopis cineraria]|uniref:uncharacterized protein LOC129317040 n=1 Tax=Prosopis cineraria TaxID=364024 RepID=UPI00240FD942